MLLCVSVDLYAEEEKPNFVVGLGYGLLDSKSLLNLDMKINMPVNDYLTAQVLLNSNYLIIGSNSGSFAQSEFFSNWYLGNEHGRLGLGLGYSELEPMDKDLPVDREVIGQVSGDLFIGKVSLIANIQSNNATLSSTTSSRFGMGYYFDDNLRVSFYREKFNDLPKVWRLESFYQPPKYHDLASIGVILRTNEEYDYLGVMLQYFFDYKVSLKTRERRYY
ncbi:hypothetical protein THO17_10880 [Marinomonas sp. THO17]